MANGAIPIPQGAQLVPLNQSQGGSVPIPAGATLQPLSPPTPPNPSERFFPSSPEGTIGPASLSFLDKLNYNLRQKAQSGTSMDISQAPSSPITGLVKAAKGVQDLSGGEILSGLGEAASIPLAFLGGPTVSKGAQLADAATSTGASNALATILRKAATPAQSLAGEAGTIRPGVLGILDRIPFLKPLAEAMVPQGELGTVTHPGPYARVPIKVAQEATPAIGAQSKIVVRPATDLAEQAAAQGFETAARPSGRMVLTPSEATSEEQLSKVAAKRAKERGMQFAGGMVPREGRKVPWRPTVLPPDE